jgi:acetyl esterase/lipase
VPKTQDESAFQILTYKVINDRQLKLWLQFPTQQIYEKAPIVFLFPSGDLIQCNISNPFSIFSKELSDLNRLGFAVVTIEHRVMDEGVTPEDILSDCMDAMRYISYYSQILNVDPHNIITAGHGTGGTIALLAGYAPHWLFDADDYWFEANFRVVGTYALAPHTIFYPGEDGTFDGYYSEVAADASL